MRILTVIGTRPEAIKMCVLAKKLSADNFFDHKVCSTGQHTDMLDQVMNIFGIKKDYDLQAMDTNLNMLCSNILKNITEVYNEFNPDLVLVHGDTSSAVMAAIAAFHKNIKIGHVEAGLRTWNLSRPFPEEFNRITIDKISDYYFAPTKLNFSNLIQEGIDPQKIVITGNTGIDALFNIDDNHASNEIKNIFDGRKIILITGHRRENFGQGFENICAAIKNIAIKYPNVLLLYPVHLNPNVKNIVTEKLSNISNVMLVKPLDYVSFVYAMKRSYIILTDSGGVQEEAPTFGIPVLVMRTETERQEAIESGCVKLVGSNSNDISIAVHELLHDEQLYKKMTTVKNPYGDGTACDKIINFLKKL